MAKKKEDKIDIKAFSKNMLKNLNTKLGGKGGKIFYDLGADSEDPAQIVRWYSSRSMSLDAIAGAGNKGMPGGRMVEIFGPESIGKSHICYQVARDVQEKGGFVCYVDTELATEKKNIQALGVRTSIEDGFFYGKVDSIEGAFEAIEEFLKEVAPLGQQVPIAIIWDSIGGIGSRLERDMGFDDVQRPGLNAKQLTFGIRKIMPAINESGALFLLVNQEYDILNAMKFDSKKKETKGGKMIKYAASVRIGVDRVTDVYPEELDKKQACAQGLRPIGIKVRARTYKNKVAAPYRSVEFEIHFGVGIKEHMQIWDMFKDKGELTIGDEIYQFGNAAWKTITIVDAKTGEQKQEIKFRKKETKEILMEKHRDITEKCFDTIMGDVMLHSNKAASEYDPTLDGRAETEDDIMKEIE